MITIYLNAGYMWLIGVAAFVLAIILGFAVGVFFDSKVENEDTSLAIGLIVAIVGFFLFGILLLWLFNSPENANNTEPVLGLLTSF